MICWSIWYGCIVTMYLVSSHGHTWFHMAYGVMCTGDRTCLHEWRLETGVFTLFMKSGIILVRPTAGCRFCGFPHTASVVFGGFVWGWGGENFGVQVETESFKVFRGSIKSVFCWPIFPSTHTSPVRLYKHTTIHHIFCMKWCQSEKKTDNSVLHIK